MLALERLNRIMQMIEEQKTVKVSELSKYFEVTEETIRRDLDKLVKTGTVKKTYGGAILIDKDDYDDPTFDYRVKENTQSKIRIGKAISRLIKSGQTIMLDSSTTCLEVARHLKEHQKLTVITNSINSVAELGNYTEITTVATGGILRNKSLSLIGPTAKKNIESYYADVAIISCKAMSMERGVMESNELEKEIKQAFIAAAKEVVLALDSTKIGKSSMYKLVGLSEITTIVTDQPLDAKWIRKCEENNIIVVVAE